MTHKILVFVTLLFTFKKENIRSNKDKPFDNTFKIAKKNLFTWRYFKNPISLKPMEESVKSDSIEKFKAVASTVEVNMAWGSGSNTLQVLTCYSFSRSVCYDGTRY